MHIAYNDFCQGGKEEGFVLVGILIFVLTISFFAIPLTIGAQMYAFMHSNLDRRDYLDLAGRGIADAAMVRLTAARGDASSSLVGTFAACRSARHVLIAATQDHSGLIDLNAAEPSLLSFGFTALGSDAREAERLADAAVRYRSPDGPTGDVDRFGVDILGGLKHARFESVLELSDFAPLADMPPQRLQSVFTVHSRTGTITRPSMSEALARKLSDAPLDVQQFITDERSAPNAVTVEVTVKEEATGLVGYSGLIVVGGRPVEKLPRPVDTPVDAPIVDCRSILGDEVARTLMEQL